MFPRPSWLQYTDEQLVRLRQSLGIPDYTQAVMEQPDKLTTVHVLTWQDFYRACDDLLNRLPALSYQSPANERMYRGLYGIPAGGCFVAMRLSQLSGIPLVDNPGDGVLVLDDFIKTGETARCFQKYGITALFRHRTAPLDLDPNARIYDGELQFPWTRFRG